MIGFVTHDAAGARPRAPGQRLCVPDGGHRDLDQRRRLTGGEVRELIT